MNSTALVRNLPEQTGTILYHRDEWMDEEGGSSLNISELRAFLIRQRYLIGGVILGALLIAVAATMLMRPVYRATATLQIEPNVPIVKEGQEATAMVTAQNMQEFRQGQIDVLKSRNLASRVANALDLSRDQAFLAAVDIEPTNSQSVKENVLRALQSGLTADLPLGSQTAQISFDSSDPHVSSKVANAYADNLITGNIERRYQASSYARRFLGKELDLAKRRLEASERSTLAYARSSQIVNTGGGGTDGDAAAPPSLSAASLIQMNADLATARTARINAEQRWRTAAATPIMSLPEVIENGTIGGLQADRARLRAQLQKLRQTFNDDYPEVARAKAELASADAQISSIANQIRSSIRERYEVAARQEAAISSRMSGLRADTLRDQDRRVQFDMLNREAAANRDLYTALLQRYREVSTAAGIANNNISILDLAVPSGQPIKPRPLVNLALGLMAGLGLGLLFAFIRERLHDTIRLPDEILNRLGQPLLGTTPAVATDVQAQLGNSKSGLSEAYHSISSSIDFAFSGASPRSLLITSSRAREGKSTTAVAVARNMSRNGRRVLLVDADLRLPSLHRFLGTDNKKGLVNVIVGRAQLKDVVQARKSFAFLPSGPIPPNPTELLAPHHLVRFLQEAFLVYDMVILDGPPVMGLADSPQMARAAEATVLVIESGKAHRNHIQTAIRRLHAANANLIGIVLTKFSPKATGYSNDYGYAYQYGSSEDIKQLGTTVKEEEQNV